MLVLTMSQRLKLRIAGVRSGSEATIPAHASERLLLGGAKRNGANLAVSGRSERLP
jgi:hypothetical protein